MSGPISEVPAAVVAPRRPHYGQIALAVAAGVTYGIVARLAFTGTKITDADTFAVMTFAFVVLVPASLGAWVAILMPKDRRIWQLISAPWTACMVSLVASMLLHLEGSICIFFMAPALFFFASVGALIAHLALSMRERRGRLPVLAAFALLPYAAAPLEAVIATPIEMRTVENKVLVKAPLAVVWQKVKSVEAIAPAEQAFGWAYLIGFPRPVAATLSRDGVGGVRRASFAGGVEFIETIDRWEEERLLSFSIHVGQVPPATLDDHVKIGGAYFDVLRGTYALSASGDDTLITLSSSHRLSTHFNRYAAIWSDWVMDDIQSSILTVIKRRCEAAH